MNRSEPAAPKSSKPIKTKRHKQGPERCQYRTPTNRQCMSSVLSPQSSFCPRHASYHATDQSDFSAPLLHNACHFLNAQGINYSLAQLYELLATGRISPRRAAVLAHITSLLMRSLHAIDTDRSPNAGKPDLAPPPKAKLFAALDPDNSEKVNFRIEIPPTPPPARGVKPQTQFIEFTQEISRNEDDGDAVDFNFTAASATDSDNGGENASAERASAPASDDSNEPVDSASNTAATPATDTNKAVKNTKSASESNNSYVVPATATSAGAKSPAPFTSAANAASAAVGAVASIEDPTPDAATYASKFALDTGAVAVSSQNNNAVPITATFAGVNTPAPITYAANAASAAVDAVASVEDPTPEAATYASKFALDTGAVAVSSQNNNAVPITATFAGINTPAPFSTAAKAASVAVEFGLAAAADPAANHAPRAKKAAENFSAETRSGWKNNKAVPVTATFAGGNSPAPFSTAANAASAAVQAVASAQAPTAAATFVHTSEPNLDTRDLNVAFKKNNAVPMTATFAGATSPAPFTVAANAASVDVELRNRKPKAASRTTAANQNKSKKEVKHKRPDPQSISGDELPHGDGRLPAAGAEFVRRVFDRCGISANGHLLGANFIPQSHGADTPVQSPQNANTSPLFDTSPGSVRRPTRFRRHPPRSTKFRN